MQDMHANSNQPRSTFNGEYTQAPIEPRQDSLNISYSETGFYYSAGRYPTHREPQAGDVLTVNMSFSNMVEAVEKLKDPAGRCSYGNDSEDSCLISLSRQGELVRIWIACTWTSKSALVPYSVFEDFSRKIPPRTDIAQASTELSKANLPNM